MPAPQRQPLNYNAPDLVAAREFRPAPLRDEIDYWRSEVQRTGVRLQEAIRLAGMQWRPAGARIDTPELAGQVHRRAKTVLHYLLALEEMQRGRDTASEN